MKLLKLKKLNSFFKKTYFNPSTRADVIKKIIKINPQWSKDDITHIYQKLVKLNHSFMENNKKFDSNMEPFFN